MQASRRRSPAGSSSHQRPGVDAAAQAPVYGLAPESDSAEGWALSRNPRRVRAGRRRKGSTKGGKHTLGKGCTPPK
jgi:hypothetical protein